jgi:hypothetical protein
VSLREKETPAPGEAQSPPGAVFSLPWIDFSPLSEGSGALRAAFSPPSKAKSPLARLKSLPEKENILSKRRKHLSGRCFLLPWMEISLLSEAPSAPGEAFSPTLKAKSPLAKAQKPPREGKYPSKEAKTPIEEAFSVSMVRDFPSSAAIFPCRGTTATRTASVRRSRFP